MERALECAASFRVCSLFSVLDSGVCSLLWSVQPALFSVQPALQACRAVGYIILSLPFNYEFRGDFNLIISRKRYYQIASLGI